MTDTSQSKPQVTPERLAELKEQLRAAGSVTQTKTLAILCVARGFDGLPVETRIDIANAALEAYADQRIIDFVQAFAVEDDKLIDAASIRERLSYAMTLLLPVAENRLQQFRTLTTLVLDNVTAKAKAPRFIIVQCANDDPTKQVYRVAGWLEFRATCADRHIDVFFWAPSLRSAKNYIRDKYEDAVFSDEVTDAVNPSR